MSKIIKLIGIILIVGAALFFYFYTQHPIVFKDAAGSARILSPPLDASVKVDGDERPLTKVFAMKTSFDGKPIDSFVLWIPDSSAVFGRDIIIIDKANHFVGRPNSNIMDYDLLLDRYLFQSESGSLSAPFAKGERYEDTQLEFENNTIKFKVHTMSLYLAGKKVEVNIKTPSV